MCITRSPCLSSFFCCQLVDPLVPLHALLSHPLHAPWPHPLDQSISKNHTRSITWLVRLPHTAALVTAAAAAVGPCGGGQWQYALCFLIPIALVCVELPRRREKLTATTMTPMGHSSAMRRIAQTMFGLVLESASATKYKANQTGETRNCFSRCSYFCIVQFS